MKTFSFKFYKKTKHSGIHLLPMVVLNVTYKKLTIALFVYVLDIYLNTNNEVCSNCGAKCRNTHDANNHCLDNLF